jgi:hypothetical protein
MERRALKNKSEQLRRGKRTLVKQAHKLATVHNIDIAIIMHKNGQYCTSVIRDLRARSPDTGLSSDLSWA